MNLEICVCAMMYLLECWCMVLKSTWQIIIYSYDNLCDCE